MAMMFSTVAEILQVLRDTTVAGNALWRILALFISILLGLIAGRLGKVVLEGTASQLERRNRSLSSLALRCCARSAVMIAFVIGLGVGLKLLEMSAPIRDLAETVVGVLLVFSLGWLLFNLVDVVETAVKRVTDRTETRMDDMLVPMVRKSLRVTIIILVLLQVATMLSDKPITSILAALGVGGLAVALAAQDTIKNFFGSLVILADKPFVLGDRVTIDSHDGTIEEVGFRSTRLRTLEGHVVTMPNGELANKSVVNITRRHSLRRILNITITYDTPPDKVDRAVEIVKEILDNHEGLNPEFPPRVYFNAFNDASLNIFAIYWYFPADWWPFNAFNEQVNRQVLRRFNEEGIEFAFPTQTLYLAGDPARPLSIGKLGGS